MLHIFFVTLLLFVSGCTSMKDASMRYFQKQKYLASVESPDDVIERINDNKIMREALYGVNKSGTLIQCTMLRNQLITALIDGLSGKDGKKIQEAAIMMEQAFQESEDAFLHVCAQIKDGEVGKVFLATQKDFYKNRQ